MSFYISHNHSCCSGIASDERAGDALIVQNDLKEALAQLAVIVDLTNKFEDIYSIRIHVVHQRTGVYPARYTFQ